MEDLTDGEEFSYVEGPAPAERTGCCPNRRPSARMTPLESVSLAPWEKFRRFGRVPWKMLLQIILVGLVTTTALLRNDDYARYSRSVGRTWTNLLFPGDYRDRQVESQQEYQYYIYTVNDTLADAQHLVDSYYALPVTSVDNIEVCSADRPSSAGVRRSSAGAGGERWRLARAADRGGLRGRGEVEAGTRLAALGSSAAGDEPLSTPFVLVHHNGGGEERYELYNSTEGWPLSGGSRAADAAAAPVSDADLAYLGDFFGDLRELRFHFEVRSYGWTAADASRFDICLVWEVAVVYDLSVGGQVAVEADYRAKSRCDEISPSDKWVLLSLSTFSVAAALLLLIFKSAFAYLRLLFGLRRLGHLPSAEVPLLSAESQAPLRGAQHVDAFGIRSESSEDGGAAPASASERIVEKLRRAVRASCASCSGARASWRDVLPLLQNWTLLTFLGATAAAVFSGQLLLGAGGAYVAKADGSIFLGAAAMLLWLGLAQFLEYLPQYYVLVVTMKRAAPRVGRLLAGALPFFVGYMMLGMTLFGDQCAQFGSALDTVATLFSVLNGDVLLDTFQAVSYMPYIGTAYVICFTVLFTYVLLMTMIAVIEEAFFSAQGMLQPRGHADGSGGSDSAAGAAAGAAALRGEAATGATGSDRPISAAEPQPEAQRHGSERVLPRRLKRLLQQASVDAAGQSESKGDAGDGDGGAAAQVAAPEGAMSAAGRQHLLGAEVLETLHEEIRGRLLGHVEESAREAFCADLARLVAEARATQSVRAS